MQEGNALKVIYDPVLDESAFIETRMGNSALLNGSFAMRKKAGRQLESAKALD